MENKKNKEKKNMKQSLLEEEDIKDDLEDVNNTRKQKKITIKKSDILEDSNANSTKQKKDNKNNLSSNSSNIELMGITKMREMKEIKERKALEQAAEIKNILNDALTTSEVQKQENSVPCIMNFRKIYDETQTYEVFTCLSCPGKPENICYICISLCHKNHKTGISKKVNLKEVKCSCSLKDHTVTQLKHNYAQIDDSMKNIECNLNEILHRSNCSSYYLDPQSHVYYCIYCLNYCMEVLPVNSFDDIAIIDNVKYNLVEHSLKDYVKKDKGKFINPPVCQCKRIDHHDSIERNNYCIIEMMDNIYYDKFFNRIQLPNQIIMTPSLNEKFIKPIIEYHKEILSMLNEIENDYNKNLAELQRNEDVENGINKNESPSLYSQSRNKIIDGASILSNKMNIGLKLDKTKTLTKSYDRIVSKYQVKDLDAIYLSCVELLKSFERIFSIDYFYVANPQLQACFDIDFLLKVLDVPEIKNDNFFIVKVNSLVFFRKFYLMPKLKYQNWKNFSNFENISPIHRLLFRKTFEEFTTIIEIPTEKYLMLLEKIFQSICNADWFVREEELISMVVEFLELLLITITCKFENNEGMIYHFTKKIHAIMNIIYTKVQFESLMKSYMEKIILYILLINNDSLFLDSVLNKNKIDYQDDDSEGDSEDQNREKKIGKNSSKKILNFIDNVYSNIKTKLKLSDQEELTPEELEAMEEERIKKLQRENLPFNNGNKYSFENGKFQTILLKTLFAYRKGKEIANYLESCYIYDILSVKEDFYSDSVKVIAKCKKKLFNSNLIEFLDNFSKYVTVNKIDKEDKSNNENSLFNYEMDYNYNKSNNANNVNYEFDNKLKDYFSVEFLNKIKEEMLKLESFKKMFYEGIYNKGEVYYTNVDKALDSLMDLLNNPNFRNMDILKLDESKLAKNEINVNEFKKELQRAKTKLNMFNKSSSYNSNNNNFTDEALLNTLNDTKEKLFEKQLILYKINLFDTLIAVCASFSVNNYFKIHMRDKTEKILDKTLTILSEYLLYDNPFLMAIFYNTEPLNFLFEVATSKLLSFYYDSLKIMNKYYYLLNTEPLLDKIISKYNLKEWDKNIADSCIILKIFSQSLKITKEKSIGLANSKISFEIKNILTTDAFNDTINNYILELQDIHDSNITIKDLPQNVRETFDKMEQFLFLVFKCIAALAENYFYLINDFLCIDKIDILLNFNTELNPKFRRVLTFVYSRFYVQSPFHIIDPSKMNDKNYTDLEKVQNLNLIGKITLKSLTNNSNDEEDEKLDKDKIKSYVQSTKKIPKINTIPEDIEENLISPSNKNLKEKNRRGFDLFLEKKNSDESKDTGLLKSDSDRIKNDTNNLPVFETSALVISRKNTGNVADNNVSNKNKDTINKVFNKQESKITDKHAEDKELNYQYNNFKAINQTKGFGLNKIFKSLEKFKTYYETIFTDKYQNDIEFMFKYFEDTVLYPCTFAIFKVCYFSPVITAKAKYIVYKLIFLYLQCQKFLFEYLQDKLSDNKILINLIEPNDSRKLRIHFQQQMKLINCLDKHLHLKDFSELDEEEDSESLDNESVIKDNNMLTLNSNEHLDKKIEDLSNIEDNKENEKMKIIRRKTTLDNMNENYMSFDQKLFYYHEKINKILNNLNIDVDEIGSKAYEHLNVIKVLESWYKYAIHFKIITPYLNLEYFVNKKKMENKDFSHNKEDNNGEDKSNNKSFASNSQDNNSNKDVENKEKELINVIMIGKRLLRGVRKTGVNFINAVENLLGIHSGDVQDDKATFISRLVLFVEDYDTKKENFDESNVLCNLFMEENDPDIYEIKKSIAFDVLFKLIDEEFFKNSISLYDENDTVLISIINKLFITNPELFQELIQNNVKIVKSCVFNYIQKQTVFLSQFVMIEFARADSAFEVTMKQNLIEIFEFLRLFCENHHKIYQTFLITINLCDRISFLDFLFKLSISVLKSLELFKDRKPFIIFFKEHNNNYFEDVINKIFDLLIEIFQGCLPSNFDILANNVNFNELIEVSYKYLDFIENEEAYEFYFAHFFRFINTFMEEITNSDKNKSNFIKKLNPKKLLSVCMFCFKKFYYKTMINDTGKGFINYNFNEEDLKRNLLDKFLVDEDLKEDNLFILITGIYTYMKNACQHKQSASKIIKIFNSLEEIVNNTELVLNDKNRPLILLKREMSKFFSNLIKDVEISYKFKESIEEFELYKYKELFEESDFEFSKLSNELKEEFTGIQKVNYLINTDSLFLSPKDIKHFLDSAPYDDFNSKLNHFLEYYSEKINNMIQMRKNLWSYKSTTLKLLYRIDYNTLAIISVIFSIVVNIFLLLGFKYVEEKIYHMVTAEDRLKYGKSDWEEIIFVKSFKYTEITFIISLIHMIILSFALLNYISFGYLKFFKSISSDTIVTWKEKISEFFSIISNEEIRPLLFNFLFGLIAIIGGKEKYFFYSFQLFIIFNFFPTMESVIISVRSRYKQFLSAALLICIMILFYSSISFFIFSSEYYNDSTNENVCDSLLHCFLYLFNYGLRSGSLGLPLKQISQDKYWSEFLFDWIFYFSLILILLNIINGIIVDTFQALREQNNEKEYVKNNVCYICSIDRSKFEMKGVDYDYHLVREHNILNYFHYIIKVLRTFEQDLNSLDYEVLKAIKKNSTEFFPVKKALSLGD